MFLVPPPGKLYHPCLRTRAFVPVPAAIQQKPQEFYGTRSTEHIFISINARRALFEESNEQWHRWLRCRRSSRRLYTTHVSYLVFLKAPNKSLMLRSATLSSYLRLAVCDRLAHCTAVHIHPGTLRSIYCRSGMDFRLVWNGRYGAKLGLAMHSLEC